MGTFIGHLVPGLALACLGLWHMINAIQVYYLQGPTKFTIRFWYPLKCPLQKLELLEVILVLSFSILAILVQVLDLQHLHFSFRLDGIEHATIFVQLVIFAGFTLLTELNHLSDSMLGVSGILISSVFGMELFLLHYHSTDHVGLEGHYHWLMQLIVCVSFLAALSATSFPTSFHSAMILSISVVFQGCWFINMGFMLWIPNFIPEGCVMQKDHGYNAIKGAVVCGSHDADLRARALANLQFCWILSSISVFMACVCIAYGRKCARRRQTPEYERLFSLVNPDPVSNAVLKQIQL